MGRQTENSLSIVLTPGVEIEYLRVPVGKFLMGSDKRKDPEARYDELPQHEVYLDEYWMGKYAVTNAQYEVFVKAIGYEQPRLWHSGMIPTGKKTKR